jgi:hypothetical protein
VLRGACFFCVLAAPLDTRFCAVPGVASLLRFEVVYEHCATLMVACWVLVLLQVTSPVATQSRVCFSSFENTFF